MDEDGGVFAVCVDPDGQSRGNYGGKRMLVWKRRQGDG